MAPIVSDIWSKDAEIQVVDHLTGQSTSPNLVVPRRLSELSRPPSAADVEAFNTWTSDNDGVFAENMSVGFLARSEQVEPTIITALRVEVVSREEPMQGTWIVPDGGGPQSERIIMANLDADPPTAILDGSFAFPLRINSSDTEMFSVRAQAQTCHCYWRIELDIIGPDGESRTVTVDDNGDPFELTGTANTQDRTYLPRSPDAPWPSAN